MQYDYVCTSLLYNEICLKTNFVILLVFYSVYSEVSTVSTPSVLLRHIISTNGIQVLDFIRISVIVPKLAFCKYNT